MAPAAASVWWSARISLFAVALLFAADASAQSLATPAAQATAAAHDWATWRPTAPATRIDPAEAPQIDGDISEPVWQKAPAIDEFYQLEPDTGHPGTERTVVRVLYDESNLYVSFYCYDKEPDKVIATVKARDGNTDGGDFVRVYIDPGQTRRDGYAFVLNPLGMRVDVLIKNNTDYLVEWNTLWAGNAKRVADGWTAEFSIPFRSISYDASRSDWGFDLSRYIRRKNERIRWSSISATIPSVDISRSGTLTGIHDLTRGIGLDVQLYGSVRYKHEWTNPRQDDVKLVESGNAYYRITPGITGTLTVDPDFSDTPLDERKINTTRFALFLPETRDFFLQDAASFEFGGQSFVNDSNGQAFFSRNVGLVNGEPVPIIAGGKISGDYDGLSLGGFTAMTQKQGDLGRQELSVLRATYAVLSESKVGFIATNGNPTGDSRNSTVGTDFQYRTSVFGGQVLQVDTSYLESIDNKLGDGSEAALMIFYPNEPWGGQFRFKRIDDNFFPALGFVNRPGIMDFHPGFWYRPRFTDSWMRWLEVGVANDTVTGLDGHLQSVDAVPYIGVTTSDQGDLGFFYLHEQFESVPAPFSFGGHAEVPAGNFRWTSFEAYLQTSLGRPWQVNLDVYCCNFYDGHIFNADLQLDWRPNGTIEIIPHYVVALIDLPSGSVDIHVLELTANVNFTPDMQLSAQGQWDNQSQNFGFSLRYRWEYELGNQIFVALGESALINGPFWQPHYASQESQMAIRIGHTLRF